MNKDLEQLILDVFDGKFSSEAQLFLINNKKLIKDCLGGPLQKLTSSIPASLVWTGNQFTIANQEASEFVIEANFDRMRNTFLAQFDGVRNSKEAQNYILSHYDAQDTKVVHEAAFSKTVNAFGFGWIIGNDYDSLLKQVLTPNQILDLITTTRDIDWKQRKIYYVFMEMKHMPDDHIYKQLRIDQGTYREKTIALISIDFHGQGNNPNFFAYEDPNYQTIKWDIIAFLKFEKVNDYPLPWWHFLPPRAESMYGDAEERFLLPNKEAMLASKTLQLF